MTTLGVSVPVSAFKWVDQQIERLWHLRGPAPGLTAVLGEIGVESAHQVVRRLMAEPDWDRDPWGLVERALDRSDPLGQELGSQLPTSVGHTWRGLTDEERTGLKILSAMDVGRNQVLQPDERPVDLGGHGQRPRRESLLRGHLHLPVDAIRSPWPPSTRHAFQPDTCQWVNLIDSLIDLNDPGDARRLEALIVDVLERLAEEGDTIAGESQVLTAASNIPLARPCPVSALTSCGLQVGPTQPG